MLDDVRKFCLTTNCPQNIIDKIVLATEEALVNIISYSYPQANGLIDINCSFKDPSTITLCIKDFGIPFDPIKEGPLAKSQTAPQPTLDGPIKKGGYGIYIYVGVMDEVVYNRLEDSNLLILTKHF